MNSSSGSSSGSRLQEFVMRTPLFTLSLLIFNVLVHILVFVLSIDISDYVFQPYRVFYLNEYYRIITSAFLHGGLMHIGMNMMSLVAIGGMLEPLYGSVKFLWITWMSILLGGFCYLALAGATAWVTGNYSYLLTSSIGYSGVLFSYAVIEAFHSADTSRSVFGCFNVPTKAYPFILLIIIQFMLPNISLFGHLGGLLSGVILMTSFGSMLFVPSQGCFDWLEESVFPNFLKRMSTFRPNTSKEFIHPYFEVTEASRFFIAIGNLIGMMLMCFANLFITLCEIVGLPMNSYCLACQESIARQWRALTERSSSTSSLTSSTAPSAPPQPDGPDTNGPAARSLFPAVTNPFHRGGASNGNYELVPSDSNHGADVEAPSNPQSGAQNTKFYVNPHRLQAQQQHQQQASKQQQKTSSSLIDL